MSELNIFYDHQIFSLQQFGGISRYFVGLIQEFHQRENIRISLGGFISDNLLLKDLEFLKRNTLPSSFRIGRKTSSFILNTLYDNLISKKWDIYHPTYYYSQYLLRKTPMVITVHDMTHEKFPQNFSGMISTSYWKKEQIKKATKIIAISENTKKDIVEIFNVSPDKIDVVYHCFELKGKYSKDNKISLPEKYLLFVGNRSGYKNFPRLMEAIGRIFSKHKEYSLFLAGGGPLSRSEMEQINMLGILKKVIQKNLSDQELIAAYSNATCFVFPSLYEGFGIPILEAFQCQCPVVLSDTSSFPEVAGEAGIYFDPYSIDSIENAISRVMEDETLRRNLRLKGTERLKNFSRKKVAEETLSVYRRAIG